jgi:tetratricopeptide (TPR) repeat protein
VAAYRQALKVRTREAAPDQWALVHLNLGNALASLGDRDVAATSRHEEAVIAYNRALEVFTRDSAPLRWAITQMNLGTALIRLGERGEKRHHWLAAAAAMVPALDVFEAEGAKDYADLTRNNLRKFHTQWEKLIGPATDVLPLIEGRARVVAKAV